ncbi:MAG: YajQ family cyclic di-GMP-binding protein [Planctomycetota bacterium]|nr:MAG: YajQ family cyclic di-GMP-binding protein [Planctomycetota bacterium]
MAKNASMDIESEVDFHEFENAVNQAVKEASSRYDFKGSIVKIDFNKTDSFVKLIAENEMKLSALESILRAKLHKRGVDSRCLKDEKIENSSLKEVRQRFLIRSGLEKDDAKKIVKIIKQENSKLQASIQDSKLKVIGKTRDDLQDCIRFLKEKQTDVPLQFTNFKS